MWYVANLKNGLLPKNFWEGGNLIKEKQTAVCLQNKVADGRVYWWDFNAPEF